MQQYSGISPPYWMYPPMAHPYFGVTGATGEFQWKDLPVGEYTVAAWHESLGELVQQITVSAGGTASVKFDYK